MNPNDNQSIPSDYLNQIAVKPPSKANFIKEQPILFGAVCIFIVLVVIIIANSMFPNKTEAHQQLAARLSATKEVVEGATSKIKDSDLRALNSNLNIALTNAVRDIAAPLALEKVYVKKLDKKIVLAESNKKLLATLEDARLNAIYDRTYAREMTYKLETILTLMNNIYNTTKSKSLRTYLTNTARNLEPIQKQFADFNAAAS